MARPPRKKLGEALLEAGLIDDLQLRSALADQKRWGNRLGKTLVKLGFVEEVPLMRQLSVLLGYPLAEIAGREIDPEVLALIPGNIAEKHRVLPLFIDEDGPSRYLYLGMEEPADLDTLDALQVRTGFEILPALIGFRALDDGLRRHYGRSVDRGEITASDGFEIGGARVGPDCLRHGDELLEPSAEAPPPEPEPVPEAPAAPPAETTARPEAPAKSLRTADVPTRRILQGLIHVLVDKGVLTRDELLDKVREITERDGG